MFGKGFYLQIYQYFIFLSGKTPLAQKAKLRYKLLLLQRLDENLKQKQF